MIHPEEIERLDDTFAVIKCRKCKQGIMVPATEAQVNDWRAGQLIQRAMPGLSADERELLISGYCGACFDSICGE